MFTHAKAWRSAGLTLAAAVAVTSVAACGGNSDASNSNANTNAAGSGNEQVGGSLTLGYFPNLTHGSAIVGVEKGFFKKELAKNGASLKTQIFDSGSDTLEALAGGSLDATYIGPAPSITAFAQS